MGGVRNENIIEQLSVQFVAKRSISFNFHFVTILSVGGFDISLLLRLFCEPLYSKRNWLYSKVHIPHAPLIFDGTFRIHISSWAGRANGWAAERLYRMTTDFRRLMLMHAGL